MKTRFWSSAIVLAMLALAWSAAAEPVTITGTVIDADGDPVEGAKVWLMQAGHIKSPTIPVVTNEEGWFAINSRGFPPVYSRAKEAYLPLDLAIYAQGPDGQRAAAQVIPPDVIEVIVALGDAGFLETHAEDRDGNPMAGMDALLLLNPEGRMSYGAPVRFASEETGLLSVGPIPAETDFGLFAGGEASGVLLHEWPEQEMTPLAAGETRELPSMFVNMAGRKLEGVVLDADGDPVAGTAVMTPDAVDRRLLQVRTDGEGRFELSGLKSAGVVGIVAIADDATAVCGGIFDPDGGLDATLQLEPFVVLTGVVTDAEGQPCAGALVSVIPRDVNPHSFRCFDLFRDPPSLRAHVFQALEAEAEADENGRWRIEPLVPGLQYQVIAHDLGWERRGQAVTIVPSGLDVNEVAVVLK